jgi:hypothetical protein
VAEDSDEISGHLGYLLPNQITGVTEVMPVFGFRYAYPLATAFDLESGIENTHADGVDFTSLTVDLRGEFEPVPQFLAVFYAGASFYWYIPSGQTDRQTDWGGNAGLALMTGLTDTLWLRGDLKFNANPGTSLYIGFGLAFRTNGT